ncbi:condensin complex subunit 3-like isoform X2 [Rhynchophorus ferrugineus]|uniref:condensin complex subunit 3-like isoform X2 n=1 Tax=Rhynchophorus ferrugineus TaxID=354439 RepID=UPI003FCC41D1
MDNDEKLIYQIAESFSSSQNTTATHKKNSVKLLKLYENTELTTYYEAFLPSLYKVLNTDIKIKSLNLDRIIEFVGQFLSDINQNEKFDKSLFSKIVEYLLQASQCIDDNIRYRACQIITNLLEHLVGSEISDDLCSQIEMIFLDRLYDPKTVVRLLAIRVLYRLQDPQDPEDRIHSEFLKIIRNDMHAKVRELCVEKIILNRSIIEQIIKRTRDIDVSVRLVAFKRLSGIVKSLKIGDRRTILTAGIYDLSEKVQKFVYSVFLDTWLKSFDNDIFVLMEALRYDGDEKDINETLHLYKNILHKFYFKSNSSEMLRVLEFDEVNTIPYQKLNWGTISYWRLLIDYLKEAKLDDQLENVMPEPAVYFKYVKGYIEETDNNSDFLEKQFIIKELFHITKTYDYSDPPTRQSLNNLVEYVLKNADLLDSVVEDIIDCLKLSMTEVEKRSRFVCEIISDLLYPIDEAEAAEAERVRQFQLSTLTTKLIILQGEQSDAVQRADYLDADRLKKEIEFVAEEIKNLRNAIHSVATDEVKKKTDLMTVTKCLDIACGILRTLGMSDLTTSLKTLKTDVIEDFLMYDNDIVRTKAFKCYAIFCIFDKCTALNGIHMFALPILAYQAGEECDMQTLIVCIGAVVDLIRIYGADLIAEPDEEQLSESVNEEHQMVFSGGTSLTQVIQGLVDLMDDSQYEVQEIAGKGLCQLILNERIHSSTLLCKLILKWCNPADTGDPEQEPLKQIIAHTLSKVPQLPRSVDQLQDVFMLTVRVLATAPKSSPLSEVNIDDIVKFMLALCDTSPVGPQLHAKIAKSLCSTMTLKPNSNLNLMYSKILTMLKILRDEELEEDLLNMCDNFAEDISNKKILANLVKFKATLVFDKKMKTETHIESSDDMDED